jgi:hypothetical protein
MVLKKNERTSGQFCLTVFGAIDGKGFTSPWSWFENRPILIMKIVTISGKEGFI